MGEETTRPVQMSQPVRYLRARFFGCSRRRRRARDASFVCRVNFILTRTGGIGCESECRPRFPRFGALRRPLGSSEPV